MKKITLFSKIQAVRAHESERVSWASQLSLQTLYTNRAVYCSSVARVGGSNSPPPRKFGRSFKPIKTRGGGVQYAPHTTATPP